MNFTSSGIAKSSQIMLHSKSENKKIKRNIKFLDSKFPFLVTSCDISRHF